MSYRVARIEPAAGELRRASRRIAEPQHADPPEAIEDTLSPAEQARFLTELNATYDEGRAARRMAGAYLSASLAT